MKADYGDFDRQKLDRALTGLFHQTAGMRRALGYPLATPNRNRITREADALDELAAFAEWAINQKETNHDRYCPHVTLRSPSGSRKPHVREVSHA